jgi:hypothetical protein
VSRKPAAEPTLAATIEGHWGDRRDLSGSPSPWLTCNLANQVLRVPWRSGREDPDTRLVHDRAVLAALAGVAPRDPVEGLLAAQMVAVHEAAMECFRRAALAEQTFAGRELGLRYGEKLARTYAALVGTLDRHRGKGRPQVVRVERVTVEAGGRAIVGAVTQGGGGGHAESEGRPHAQPALAHAPEPERRGADARREPVPLAGGERQAAVPDARRRQGQRRAAR